MRFTRVLRWIVVVTILGAVVGALLTTRLGYPLYKEGKRQLFSDSSDALDVTFWYPSFGRPAIDSDINVIRTGLIAGMREAENYEGSGFEVIDSPPSLLTADYRVVYRTWRYASVVFDVSIEPGSLRSLESDMSTVSGTAVFARTYDLWNDRVVLLSDLSDDPNVLDTLWRVVQRVLDDKEGVVDPSLVERNLHPTEESIGNIIWNGSEVIVYLSPGQVALREYGVIKVRIPLEELQ